MHYPSDPQQPGPIYFPHENVPYYLLWGKDSPDRCTRAYTIFRSAWSSQHQKGIQCHHQYATPFFLRSLGESCLQLHANNYFEIGVSWNTWHGEFWPDFMRRLSCHSSQLVTPSFSQIPWCFRLFKRALERAKVGCLNDIARVCERSANVSYVQLVGEQDGTVLVPTSDWGTFFKPLLKSDPFKGIKSLHHLRKTRRMFYKGWVRQGSARTPEGQLVEAITTTHCSAWGPSICYDR